MIIGEGDGAIQSQRLVSDDEISNPELPDPRIRRSHSRSESYHSHRNSSNCLNLLGSSNELVSRESNQHVVGLHRDDLREIMPVAAGLADEEDEEDEILIRRSASGVFRYSSPGPMNAVHLCLNKSSMLRQQHEDRHSRYDEHDGGTQLEVESSELRQRRESSTSLRRSRHNLELESSSRNDGGRIRSTPGKEKGNGMASTGNCGSKIDAQNCDEDEIKFPQVTKKL